MEPQETSTESRPSEQESDRRPYEAPRVRSGQVFERVLLQSGTGCNNASIFVDCDIPCG